MAVGLVYSIATGRLRSIVVTDPAGRLASHITHPGEALLAMSDADYIAAGPGQAGCQALVTAHTGITPAGDRTAMVNALGFVVSVHLVDTACGDTAFPGHLMVAHETAQAGWLQLGGGPLIDITRPVKRRTSRRLLA